MKKHLLFLILCLMGILTSCSQKHTRYYIGVSQCSDDEWRHKMNHEIVREALFYDGVEVEIRTAKDNNRNQIEDINYFIDRKVDLLIVAPNEAAAVTPVVEKAYGLGIPVVVIDRKILSDRYTAFVGADNCEIGKDVGQYIVNRLGGKGKILEITGLEGSTPAMERHRGLADALKADGWKFASHTWGHLKVGTISFERLQTDTEKWLENVAPLIGGTDTIIFAHGEDLAGWTDDYAAGNEKYDYLKSKGFNFYCNVDSKQYNTIIRDGYVRQSRRNLDGYRIYFNTTGEMDNLSDLFHAADIIDPKRPPVHHL